VSHKSKGSGFGLLESVYTCRSKITALYHQRGMLLRFLLAGMAVIHVSFVWSLSQIRNLLKVSLWSGRKR